MELLALKDDRFRSARSGALIPFALKASACGLTVLACLLAPFRAWSSDCDPAPSGLVSWWAGEGNATDSFGTNDGILQAGVTFTNGIVGQAFNFNGTNQWVDVPNSPGLNPTGSFTIESWIKVTGDASTTYVIMAKWAGLGVNERSYGIGVIPGYGLGFAIADAAHQSDGVFQTFNTTSNVVASNVWTHIAAVYDQSTGTRLLYVNGTNIANQTNTPITVLNTPLDPAIGAELENSSTPAGFFAGQIDELSFYSRALSGAEVQAIYAAGSAGKCPSPPVIVSQPASNTLFAGGTASFGVAADGFRPLSYQWYLGTNAVSATTNATATNATLVLTNVQVAQSGGLYSVLVTNQAGQSNSSSALLTVNPLALSCDPAPSGLVAWWAGEGNANDSFGASNGILVGGVTFTNGEVGQAFSFDGATGYVSNSFIPLTNVVDTYTMEFWAWPTGGRAGTPQTTSGIFGNSNQRYAIYPVNGGAYPVAGSGVSVGTNGISVFEHAPSYLPSLLVYNATISGWTHVAVVYSNRQPTLYVNGVAVQTGLTSAHSSSPSTPLGEEGSGYGYYSGLLDEVSIYNRALSATEILTIYASGSAGKCPRPPVIVTQPASNTLFAGGTASFGVTATGAQPLSYQWYLGTNPIPAASNSTATNSLLVITNVQVGQSGGLYSVLITNQAGSTNSATALLTVNPLVPPCDPAPAGLISWWAGESNASDSFGNNNGTLVGGVTFTNGEVGQAFSFNGSSTYVDIPNAPNLNVSNQVTIDFWMNSSPANPIGSRIEGLVAAQFYGIEMAPGNNLYFYLSTNRAASYFLTSDVNSGGLTFPTGQWHHVAATYDGTNMQMYLDGQPAGSPRPAAGNISSMDANSFVTLGAEDGRSSSDTGRNFQGLLDEVDIFNRALTSNEIAAIYAAGSPGKCPSPPVIVAQPAPDTLFAGGNATFGVAVTGSKPLSYQWYVGTNPIPAIGNPTATNALLVLTNVQLGQSGGLYSVLVTNQIGQTNSASALLTVNAAPPCDPAPAGLVSWWAAEGNVNDSFGTNNGTLVGGATFTNGEAGQAFSFNGSTAYVDVPDSPGLELNSQITIEAWINPTITNGGQSIVAKISTATGLNGYQLALISNNQQLVGQFNSPGLGWPSWFVKAPVPVNLGTWNHVAWTYDQSAMVLYYNGQPVATNVIGAHPIATSSSDLYIGNNGPAFTGAIDEVAIYNTALSAAQIQAIYNASSVGKCPSPPVIVTQPAPDTLFAGGTASFGVAANGLRPFSYQWYLGTNPIPAVSNPTATNALLVLTNVQVGQSGGLYSVLVSNQAGQTNSSSALLTVNPLPPCDPAPAGLVGWWAGESNANDSFGTNNGTLQGGVTFTSGEVGQAFSFNGSSGTVAISNAPNLNVGNQVTIDFWMNSNPGNPVGSHIEGLVATEFYGIEMSPGNNLYFYLSTNRASSFSLTSDVNPGGLTFPAGQWHHVAATYDGTKMQMYLDGQPAGSPRAASGNISAMDATNYVSLASENGRPSADSGRYYWGLLDEVDIFNRALTSNEIAAIYAAGQSGKCPSPPVIVSQPASNTLFAGGTASFGVTANGFRPLGYQWYLGTNPIPAASNSTATSALLVLTNVQLAQSGGLYSVLITNSAGSTNSAAALLTVNPVVPPCDPVPAGLISWWAGQSNANDSFGNNNGTLQGGVTFTNGEVGQAFSFNGSTAYVDVPDSPNLELTSQITVEAWIKPLTTNGDQSLVAKISAATGIYGYQFNLSGNKLVGAFDSPGLSWPSSAVLCPLPFVLGTWSHVAWTYNQSAMILYFNGQPVATNVIGAQPIATSSADLYIGNNGPPFNGAIDEVGIYNTALSAAQIQAIYNAGIAGKCPSPPVITSQPIPDTLFAGGTATFGVAANGLRPFGYQWYLGTNPISAAANPTATNSLLVLTNVQVALSGGLYSVLVTNSAGQTNSASVLLTVNPAVPCDPAPAGLVSWWAGESNANDSFGTNNGTLQGGTTFTYGEVGQAFSFNGSTAYVDVPDSPNLELTSQISIEAWIKPLTTNGDQSIVAKISAATGIYGYQFNLSGNKLVGAFDSPGLSWPSSAVLCPLPFVPGTWYHVAWTYDQSAMKLYLNGQPVATNVIGAQPIATSTADLFIGNNGPPFNGAIDEVGIYNTALSAAQIQAIYAVGNVGKCPSPPIIAAQPAPTAVFAGGTASFGVSVNGLRPLSYQWYLGANPISAVSNPTATNALLVLTNAQLGQSGGIYSVVVTNQVGHTNSASVLLSVNPPPPCDPPPAGLIGWWPGESNALDAAGTNNGTLVGGVTYTNGEVGRAFYFNGTTADVDVPDSPSLELTNQITIEAWINPFVTNGDQIILGKLNTSFNGYQFGLTAGNELVGIFNSPGLGWPSWGVTAPVPVNLGTWSHVAWTYNQSAMILYFNGQPVATNVIGAHPIATSSADVTIGYGPYFHGAIDEPAIYNTALSAAQILAIYNAAVSGKCELPLTATAIANVLNGFVVGATVTSGGRGYTNTPGVKIIGGGGSGAQGVAVVSNGVVIAVNILNAGSNYTGTPGVVIDPPVIPNPVLAVGPASLLTFTNLTLSNAYQLQQFAAGNWSNQFASFLASNPVYSQPVAGAPGRINYRLALSPVPAQAFATAIVTNGFVIGATLTSGGSGYMTAPAVVIVGGGGTNAAAFAEISGGGVVTNVMVFDAGFGYTGTPVIQIAPPPVTALSPAISPMIRVDSTNLVPYDNYQFQFVPGLGGAWSNLNGGLFSPVGPANSLYYLINDTNTFFRLQRLP